MVELVRSDDVILTKKSEPVQIDDELLNWITEVEKFIETLPSKTGKGVAGLAAPQVGKSWRVFYALGRWYINPEITWRPKGGQVFHQERCFSYPDEEFGVWRDYAISLTWYDPDGTHYRAEKVKGFLAQVIQHEFDHIEGLTCKTKSNR